MEVSTTNKTLFLMGTQGSCFMCLEDIINSSGSNSDLLSSLGEPGSILSFKLLCQYLQVDLKKAFSDINSDSIAAVNPSLLLDQDNMDVTVPLCCRCLEETTNFSNLYHKLISCVRKIEKGMRTAEGDLKVVDGYRERIVERSASNPGELVMVGNTENLRKEMMGKFSNWAKGVLPAAKFHHLKDTRVNSPKKKSSDAQISCGIGAPSTSSVTCKSTTSKRKKEKEDDEPHPPQLNFVGGDDDDPDEEDDVKIITQQVLSEDQVTFKILPYERVQCNLCSKVIRPLQRKFHARSHTGSKPYKCDYCQHSFTNSFSRRRHKVSKHKDALLSPFKDSRLDGAQFSKLVDTLFLQLSYDKEVTSKAKNGHFKCPFCSSGERKFFARKVDWENHLLRSHQDNLSHRLMALQLEVNEKSVQQVEVVTDDPLSKRGRVNWKSSPSSEAVSFAVELSRMSQSVLSGGGVSSDDASDDVNLLNDHDPEQVNPLLACQRCGEVFTSRNGIEEDEDVMGGGVGGYRVVMCDFCKNSIKRVEDAKAPVIFNHREEHGGVLVMMAQQKSGEIKPEKEDNFVELQEESREREVEVQMKQEMTDEMSDDIFADSMILGI